MAAILLITFLSGFMHGYFVDYALQWAKDVKCKRNKHNYNEKDL